MENIEKRIADIYESAESWLPQVVEEDIAKADYHEQGVAAYYKTKVRETIDLIYNNPVGNMWIRIYNRPDDNGGAIVKIVRSVLNHIDAEQVWDKLEEFAKLHLLLLTYERFVKRREEIRPERPKATTLQEACDAIAPDSYDCLIAQLENKRLYDPKAIKKWTGSDELLGKYLKDCFDKGYTPKLSQEEKLDIAKNSFGNPMAKRSLNCRSQGEDFSGKVANLPYFNKSDR